MTFRDANIIIVLALISVGLLIYFTQKFYRTAKDNDGDQEELQELTFSRKEYLHAICDPETLDSLSEDEKDRLFLEYRKKENKYKRLSERNSLLLGALSEMKLNIPFIALFLFSLANWGSRSNLLWGIFMTSVISIILGVSYVIRNLIHARAVAKDIELLQELQQQTPHEKKEAHNILQRTHVKILASNNLKQQTSYEAMKAYLVRQIPFLLLLATILTLVF